MNDVRSLLGVAGLGLGAAAIAFACLPAAWPNPLAQGSADAGQAVPQLRAAAAAIDAACARGDLQAFGQLTTAAHRDRLARRLGAVDRSLDSGTLRELGTVAAQAVWLDQPVWAVFVRGARAAIAVARPAGDGVQVLSFVWNGRHFCFDGAHHAASVRSPVAASAAVAEATARRTP